MSISQFGASINLKLATSKDVLRPISNCGSALIRNLSRMSAVQQGDKGILLFMKRISKKIEDNELVAKFPEIFKRNGRLIIEAETLINKKEIYFIVVDIRMAL